MIIFVSELLLLASCQALVRERDLPWRQLQESTWA